MTHEVKAAAETSGRRREFLQQLAMDPGGPTAGNKHWSHSPCKQFHVRVTAESSSLERNSGQGNTTVIKAAESVSFTVRKWLLRHP